MLGKTPNLCRNADGHSVAQLSSLDFKNMKIAITAILSLALASLPDVSMAWYKTPIKNRAQPSVVCTGWHALCDAADDCEVYGDEANCACWPVKEHHIVETSKIQDLKVKWETQRRCTIAHPCGVDEAPVCRAIRRGQFTVDHVTYEWVSTYSYLGWCTTFRPSSEACTGQWADCMSAPCTEIDNPDDPTRSLNCQCRVEDTDYVGINGTCSPNGDDGVVMSTIASSLWDFENNTYVVPPPGYEYVGPACAPPPLNEVED